MNKPSGFQLDFAFMLFWMDGTCVHLIEPKWLRAAVCATTGFAAFVLARRWSR